MAFGSITILIVLVVTALVAVMSKLSGIDPFALTVDEIQARSRAIAPYAGVLILVYLFNRASHTTTGQRLSTALGVNITDELYALEGDFVAALQSLIPLELTGFFSSVYLFGFGFILCFSVIAYLFLPTHRHLKELFVAYSANYGIGALCYLLFIARGPRKVIDTVREPMFEQYPQVMTFTAEINSSANVFPSLHVSFAVTVAILAWRTRDDYPLWSWVATVLAAAIIVSTMFLGIHWLIDVIAGIGVAVVSVAIALYAVDRRTSEPYS
ncbi:phosphatase PAP2 family protein [Halosolutus gelatinilyticus]|uniref:phosphatase PAP2 family protein n=1 Tax=Halosolutus gelatinilyticus TaxID=2931975 RepID=UPI001FF2EEC6|nr:phosphatase PAP2 family protein [Halosolutus gelatinilyticus]